MCVKCEVTLPTVEQFLLMYSLRCGCIVIVVWTLLRSLFSLFIFVVAILEVLLKYKLCFGGILLTDMKIVTLTDELVVPIYFFYLAMVLAEAFLFVYCWYFVKGLMMDRSRYFVHYLVCRALTWVTEVLCLSLLCIFHIYLIGWYLGILFFVILEIYSFVVVYSYYCDLWDCENPCKQEDLVDLDKRV
ncbi:hypothetical protein ABMA27_003771 [Loxostege sticticalis]|uniref:Uncharacterized protein n=1 Tax=Loxostege sticticalis TaxID=481309 RepID=A0ABR3HQG1_LOXSC